jgi:hypothetical protein
LRPSATMPAACVRCLSSPPGRSPVMVGHPKEFTRGYEEKKLENHSGEESVVRGWMMLSDCQTQRQVVLLL